MENVRVDVWAGKSSIPKRQLMVDAIVDDIKDKIVNGDLKPGDRIPSESEMCEYYSAGRSTVRESMKILSAIGLIKILRGDGTYINDEPGSQLMYPALLSLVMSNSDIFTMMELRDAVEYSAMRLAVEKATEEDISYIVQCFDRLHALEKNDNATLEEQLETDIAFHRSFALASHNKLIVMIHDLVLQYCKPFIAECYIQTPGNLKLAHNLHDLMKEAVIKRDLALCQISSKENVTQWNKRMRHTFDGTNLFDI